MHSSINMTCLDVHFGCEKAEPGPAAGQAEEVLGSRGTARLDTCAALNPSSRQASRERSDGAPSR
jgi:hypothetical protein